MIEITTDGKIIVIYQDGEVTCGVTSIEYFLRPYEIRELERIVFT